MTCPFAHDDAAYVLGGLTPAERLAFEKHLTGCEDCTRAVRELAGLPGLLGRVDGEILERPPADQPVPDTLLPNLYREVRRGRRRHSYAVAALAAAAAAAVAVGTPVVVDHLGSGDAGHPSVTEGPQGPSAVEPRRMAPVGRVPVEATLGLESVAWGTRLMLTCTYEPQSAGSGLPQAVDYTLFVRTREGRTEQVGSWRSVGGTTMHVAAATSATRADIASVEVRTPEGRVVLRLTT